MTLPNGQPDPFAGGTSTPSVSFKDAPKGTTYVLDVTDYPELVQSRDFLTGKPKTWDDGNPIMSAVVKGTVKSGPQGVGEVRSLWAQRPSALFGAIQEAQNAAGAQVGPGSTLTVTFTHEEPSKSGGSPAKQYRVVLTPPGAFGAPPVQTAQQAVSAAMQSPGTPVTVTPAAAPPATAKQQVNAAQFAALAAAGLDVSNYEIAG